jgi:hypothetical protein
MIKKRLLSYGEDKKGRKSSIQLKLILLRGVETTLQTQQPVELKRCLRCLFIYYTVHLEKYFFYCLFMCICLSSWCTTLFNEQFYFFIFLFWLLNFFFNLIPTCYINIILYVDIFFSLYILANSRIFNEISKLNKRSIKRNMI